MALVHNPQLKGFDYTPLDQLGEDNPFTLKLKTLTPRALIILQDSIIARDSKGSTIVQSGAYSVGVCLQGIVGWSGIEDTDSKEVKIKLEGAGTISPKSLDSIPHTYYEEIASIIIAVSQDPASVDDLTNSKK